VNIKTLKLNPNKYGFDPNLMVACFVELVRYNPEASAKDQAKGAVALYQTMSDLMTANGGEMEVPVMQHCHHSKGGAC